MPELPTKTSHDKPPSLTPQEYEARYRDELEALGVYEDDVPAIGPSPADVRVYSVMLKELKQDPAAYALDVRVNAESTALRLGTDDLGSFTDRGGKIDTSDACKLVQQRFIARLLGFKVGEVRVDPRSTTANMTASFPDRATLPPLPRPDSQGVYRDTKGKELNQINVDTYYAAHYLAENKDRFDQPEALYKVFKRVTEQADGGEIRVPSSEATNVGRLSLIRQTARILGYTSDNIWRSDRGSAILKVDGVRPGFDNKNSNIRQEIATKRRMLGQQATIR